MKNQYFGDVHDYIKYGLLRQLTCHGKLSTAVCWMLTHNNERQDGHRIAYLREPESWRRFDPPLFDCLRSAVLDHKLRNVEIIENSGLLTNSLFYSNLLTDSSAERDNYLDGFLESARGAQLLFFDPDNGMEIKSVPCGRKGSSRYLYWTEANDCYSAGYSLLIYQHLPPKPRRPFLDTLCERFLSVTGADYVYCFQTTRVAFILVPQSNHTSLFEQARFEVRRSWGEIISDAQYLSGRMASP